MNQATAKAIINAARNTAATFKQLCPLATEMPRESIEAEFALWLYEHLNDVRDADFEFAEALFEYNIVLCLNKGLVDLIENETQILAAPDTID